MEASTSGKKPTQELHLLRSFPKDLSLRDSFYKNLPTFLERFGEEADDGENQWRILLALEEGKGNIQILIKEEGFESICHKCRHAGWRSHLRSNLTYKFTFTIPSLNHSSSRIFEADVHSNGFGHLLNLGGSDYLTERDLLALWDRLSASIRMRGMTMDDTTQSITTTHRVEYSIGYRGDIWRGAWSFDSCYAVFNVDAGRNFMERFTKSAEHLNQLAINTIFSDLGHEQYQPEIEEMERIAGWYEQISGLDINTLGSLYTVMLECEESVMQGKPLPYGQPRDFIQYEEKANTLVTASCTKEQLMNTANSMVQEMSQKEGEWVTFKELMEALGARGRSKVLLDVIRTVGGCAFGSKFFLRRLNSKRSVWEYTIREICTKAHGMVQEDLQHDFQFISDRVLKVYPTVSIKQAFQNILNCRRFVKTDSSNSIDYEEEGNFNLYWIFAAVSVGDRTWKSQPREPLYLPKNSTVMEMKEAGQKALREIYDSLEMLIVTSIEDAPTLQEEDVVDRVLPSGSFVQLRGIELEDSMIKYAGLNDDDQPCIDESGVTVNWKVGCICGASEDDGEEMIECEECRLWQHCRCLGLPEDARISFVCGSCTAAAEDALQMISAA